MKNICITIIIIIISASCKQVYNAPVNSAVTNYLVVDGFINNDTQGITTINLSRTTMLSDTANIIYEDNAQITIEGDGNDVYPLSETAGGVYTSAPITLNSAEKYRLRIKTADGKEYLSDSSVVKTTPDIDSVSWQRANDGVHIYINTHDQQVKYYQWRYEETWEFHSEYESSLVYTYNTNNTITGVAVYDSVTDSINEKIYRCWQSNNSTGILLGSTEKLNTNRIFLALNFIPDADWRLSVLYSIKVRQFALSQQAYQFLQIMQKNTEQIGSIFDAQPSELKGNIHCITNPAEQVVGFVEVSQEKDQRIFIQNSQVANWNYSQGCYLPMVIENDPDSIAKKAGGLYPTSADGSMNGQIKNFLAAQYSCVVCTLRGTNVKPGFWP
jgi:uncharacterized protein DUF4249